MLEIKDDKLGGSCNMQVEISDAYKILAGKPQGMRPFKRPRYDIRPRDKTQTDIRKLGCVGLNWIHLAPITVRFGGGGTFLITKIKFGEL
jgi:hypothetical protein